MTDKEKITAEIERCENICDEFIKAHPDPIDFGIARAKINMCKHIKAFIDSMQEEPVSEEFETALEKKVHEAQDWTYIEEEGGECPLSEEFGAYDLEEFARWGANWQKQQDKQWLAEEHKNIFAKGRESMKQQMMKEAVDGTVFTQLEDGKIMVRSHYFKSEKIKYLDKVKLIIIKEE